MKWPCETSDMARQCPDICADALSRLKGSMDPERVNARAHANQAAPIARLGGRARLKAERP